MCIRDRTKIDTESTPIHKMVLYHRGHNRRDSNFVAVATAQETKTASRKLASKSRMISPLRGTGTVFSFVYGYINVNYPSPKGIGLVTAQS